MRGSVYANCASSVRRVWLIAVAHWDALTLSPGAYLTAAKWRILRKRVRASGQFARLLSQSPHAYELWALRGVPDTSLPPRPESPNIIGLVQPGEDLKALTSTLESFAASGISCLLVRPTDEEHVSELVKSIDFTTKKWIMAVQCGDQISPSAGATYEAAIRDLNDEYSVIYADDDELTAQGRRTNPHFKPGWNPELQRHHDIATGACIVRADEHDVIQAMQHNNWCRALVNIAIKRGSVAHIPALLHHRRSRPTAPERPKVLGITHTLPLVSVVIPTRNRSDLLWTCIKGLRDTEYPNLEIIIADNGSDELETLKLLDDLMTEGIKVLSLPGPFNYSAINNEAVREANGDLICFMNNDVEVLSPNWLALMVTQAMRPEVGAVGAQLLYPDGRIQHAGVVIGVGNAAGHAHRFLWPYEEGYFRRHALPQFVSAVTAACLVVRKELFVAVGGFDEENFPVAFNDVDLCLKLNARGWQSFYEPRAVLVHHESVSRGQDTDPAGAARFAAELAALQRIWRTTEVIDPYHHPNLSRASEQFALDLSYFNRTGT
jgi:GT2 family glycosyltransferase